MTSYWRRRQAGSSVGESDDDTAMKSAVWGAAQHCAHQTPDRISQPNIHPPVGGNQFHGYVLGYATDQNTQTFTSTRSGAPSKTEKGLSALAECRVYIHSPARMREGEKE